MWEVDLTRIEKKFWKLPKPIRSKIDDWIWDVKFKGLHAVRKIPGYHDEPLQGDRFGQRSIRLNRSWRLIYEERKDGQIKIIQVQEVSKHEY